MKIQEIIDKVRSLNFPKGSYVVFGSSPLALAGLREAGDIDMLITKELFDGLRQQRWKELVKNRNDIPLTKVDIEVHYKWDFSSYQPTLEHLLISADFIEGIPFASLNEVRKWKKSSGRPRDLEDIKLVDAYLTDVG